MSSRLFDTHCHLASYEQAGTLAAVLGRAQEAGVERMMSVGTSRDDWGLYHAMSVENPSLITYSVGLHPCYVQSDWESHVAILEAFFESAHPPKALGEIGLDNYHLPEDSKAAAAVQAQQRDAFAQQLVIAKKLDCPLIIHSRHAFEECVQMIDESGVDWRKVVFHCFAEGAKEVGALNERGGRASFTGIITYKKAEDVREAFLAQALELCMLETDAPYLAPVPKRGKENEPAWVGYVAEFCAELLGMPLEAFAEQTTQNARRFFNV